MSKWTIADIPPQQGRLFVVTGATGGLGYETALALAGAGGEVILAGRNIDKGRDAIAKIRAVHSGANVSFERLDLASLDSVASFAGRLSERPAIDLLVNNAAVMAVPKRGLTADGFELQLGTNYLGHFALTAHLLPTLRRSREPRVVNLSSLAHRQGRIDFDDLQADRSYSPWRAYCQSKLAMLMFTFELQRRSDASGWGLSSLAAHPGWARTDIMANGPGGWTERVGGFFVSLFGQSAAAGALPTLFAATSPEARPGGYYGPDGMGEVKGSPALAKVAPQAKDAAADARLWDVSEALTHDSFGATTAVA
jgi:NAD(P)-dependent dehydrogenase (short-subunit alcohol dehydrogenase family)